MLALQALHSTKVSSLLEAVDSYTSAVTENFNATQLNKPKKIQIRSPSSPASDNKISVERSFAISFLDIRHMGSWCDHIKNRKASRCHKARCSSSSELIIKPINYSPASSETVALTHVPSKLSFKASPLSNTQPKSSYQLP